MDLFEEAPKEVTDYIRSKGLKPSFAWQDVAPEEHAYAFTVAKSAGHNILEDVFKAVEEANRKGQSFDTFRENLEPTLRKKGWWGRGLTFDDIRDQWTTGQLGSVRRLRTIYWANIQSARAAGEWQRIQRTKRFLPFLIYTRSTAERRRPEHLVWANRPVVLPVDHPWWQTHYPPNGWLCKCGVRQITRRDAEELGFAGDGDPPDIEMVRWINRRTGKVEYTPAGIDPGWATNIGLNRALNTANFLGDKLQELPAIRRPAAIADIVNSPLFKKAMDMRGKAKVNVPIAPVTEAISKVVKTDANYIFLSADSAKHILDERSERKLTPDDFAAAIEVLSSGTVSQGKDDPRGLTFIGNANGLRWRLALKVLDGEVYLVSFHRRSRGRK